MNVNNQTWNILYIYISFNFKRNTWLMRGTHCIAVRSTGIVVLKTMAILWFYPIQTHTNYKEVLYPFLSKWMFGIVIITYKEKSWREKLTKLKFKNDKKWEKWHVTKAKKLDMIPTSYAYRKVWNPTLKSKKCKFQKQC